MDDKRLTGGDPSVTGAVIVSRHRRGQSTRVAVALLTASLIAGPFAFPARTAPACETFISKEWVSIPVPEFPEGDHVITDYAVSPDDPSVIHVTNGRAVLSSNDGGCRFRASFAIESAGLSYPTTGARIVDLHLSSKDGNTVYLAINAIHQDQPVNVPVVDPPPVGPVDPPPIGGGTARVTVRRPHVVITDDFGSTWREADQGLEDALGSPLSIGGAYDSATAYLLVDRAEFAPYGQVRVSRPQNFYATTNGGGSWASLATFGNDATEPDPPGNDPTPPGNTYRTLAANPSVETEVWVYGQSGAMRSVNGGQNFANVPLGGVVPDVSEVEMLYPSPQGGAAALAFLGTQPDGFYFSPQFAALALPIAGENFETPAIATSAAFNSADPHPDTMTPQPRFAVGTIDGYVWYYHPESAMPIDISAPNRGVVDIKASSVGKTPLIYGRTSTTIERVVPPPPPKNEIVIIEDKEDLIARSRLGMLPLTRTIDEPQLIPPRMQLTLPPGASETVEHKLLLPGITKVDVAFVFDSSGSMVEEIEGLRETVGAMVEILNESSHRLNVHFGVSEYKSFKAAPYVNHYPIGPSGPELTAALNALTAGGGGEESALAALHQLATGTGLAASGNAAIPPGQQMNFRPDAVHLVVHGTDEEWSTAYPNPSTIDAALALQGVRAYQAGLSYVNEEDAAQTPTTSGPATEVLQDMASRTGAIVIGDEGVNCDADPQPELFEGDPLVCEIPSGSAASYRTTMTTAILNIIKNLPDFRSLELKDDGSGIITEIMPAQYPLVDFKIPQARPFFSEVTCPGPGLYSVTLKAMSRGAVLDTATIEVLCSTGAQADEKPIVAVGLFPPITPPGPPTLNVPVQSPVTQAQAQQQAQQQAQAQAALATQRQEQPQVAAVKVLKPSANLARADGGGSDDMNFARYRPRRRSDIPDYLPSYLVAAALGAAFGLVLRRQTRRAYATVRVGPRSRYR